MENAVRKSIIMSQVMLPHQANVAGNVHGGEIMKFMDTAAGAVAMRYAKSNVVTARADELVFHLPILVGALVTCTATVVYTGVSSMEIYIKVESEDLESFRDPQVALSAYFTMVSLDKHGHPQKVPDLIIENEEEQQMYDAAKTRRQLQKEHKKQSSM